MGHKLKTNSGAKKRFKITARGKVKRAKAFHSHLMVHKTSKRRRSLRRPTTVKKCDERRVKALLGLR